MSHSGNSFRRDNKKGILCMMVGILAFGGMDITVKLIEGLHYSPVQVLFVRGWIMSLMFLSLMFFQGKMGLLKTRFVGRQWLRSLIGVGSSFGYFLGLFYLPVSKVAVIGFGATFVMTALSVPLFKDRVGIHRWLAVVFGFIGILIVFYPSLTVEGMSLKGTLWALFGMLCYALWNLSTRWLSQTETSESLIFYYMFFVSIVMSFFVPFVWKPMTKEALLLFGFLGILGFLGQMFLTKAYFHAEIGVVAPFEYSWILLAVMADFFVWHTLPSVITWVGCAVIIFSGGYIIYHEHRVLHLKDEESHAPHQEVV